MTFFVVTAAIMAVSILLIYKLCRFFGLELKWISLVLCAMMAFGVNGATIILSPFLDQGHYFKLIALVLVAAGLVTLINEYLLKREHRQLAAAGGAVLTLETEEEEEAEEMLQAASESEAKTEAGEKLSQRLQEAVKANSTAAEAAAEAPTEEGQPEAAEAPADTAETEIETAAEEPDEEVPETTVTEAEQPEEAAEEPAPADAGEMAEAAETVETIDTAETVEDTADAGTAEADASAEKAENQETENKAEGEPVPEEDSSAAEIPATDEESPEEQPPAPAEEPAPQEESPEQPAEAAPAPQESRTISLEPEAAEAAVAELSTLDEILDFAYANKEKDVDAAITAYRAAIDRYPEDSYTPFLIIELAGMYKERASYSEAINLYAESLGMPIIAGDDAMVQEFSKTLRYLGTVQDILNKHQALATPFSKLTPEILGEIEAEFAKRQAK